MAIEKIDELLNVVGEVVITQSMLGQLAKDFDGASAERLRTGLAQLEANVRELQESVMRVRMLPVGSSRRSYVTMQMLWVVMRSVPGSLASPQMVG